MGAEHYEDKTPDEGSAFANRTKLYCMRFVLLNSFCLLGLGLLLALYGSWKLSDSETTPDPGEYATEFRVAERKFASLFCLIIGSLIGALGLLGCLTIACGNPSLACPFGFCAFVYACLSIALAVVIIEGNVNESFHEWVCDRTIEEFGNITTTEYMKRQYGALVDDVMCTDECNCDADQFERGGINNVDEQKLASYGVIGRIRVDGNETATGMIALKSSGDHEKYETCFESYAKGNLINEEISQEFVSNGGYEFLSALEQLYDCAGICY